MIAEGVIQPPTTPTVVSNVYIEASASISGHMLSPEQPRGHESLRSLPRPLEISVVALVHAHGALLPGGAHYTIAASRQRTRAQF